MQQLSFLLFLMAIVAISAQSANEPCVDGETTSFDNGCNTCLCGNGHWACTLKLCLDDFAERSKRGAECTPGEGKQEDCNKCYCTETGLWICTKSNCATKRQAQECQEGEQKEIACNTCVCSETGIWACTQAACL